VLAEIRSAAMQRAESSVDKRLQLVVETKIDITNVFERRLWELPVRFEETELSQQETRAQEQRLAFQRLARMRRINWKRMRKQILASLAERESLSLPSLLEMHPVEGEVEVMALIQIANDDGHDVSPTETEFISIPNTGGGWTNGEKTQVAYEVPRVVFRRSSERPSKLDNHRMKSKPR